MHRTRLMAMVVTGALALACCAPAADAATRPRLATDRAIVDFSPPGPLSATDSLLATVPHPWPGRAMLLSLAGCAAPFAIDAALDNGADTFDARLLIAGLTLGPAVGHLYAGQPRRAMAWSLVRSFGFALAASNLDESGLVPDGAEFAFSSGVLVVLGGAIAEVFVVPGDVHRANRAFAESRLRATLVPVRDGVKLRVACAFASP